MSRLIQWVINFFDPQPSTEFQQRMDASRKNADTHSRVSRQETERVRRDPVDTLYDRIVIQPPRREKSQT